MKRYSNGAKGFGYAIITAFIVFMVVAFTGCISFGGGPEVDMLERGQQICKDTNGEWIDHTCVYPAWQLIHTPDTSAVLGTEASG